VPVDIRQDRRNALSMRWIINAARSRKSKPMFEKLAQELLDAAVMEGGAVRKKMRCIRWPIPIRPLLIINGR